MELTRHLQAAIAWLLLVVGGGCALAALASCGGHAGDQSPQMGAADAAPDAAAVPPLTDPPPTEPLAVLTNDGTCNPSADVRLGISQDLEYPELAPADAPTVMCLFGVSESDGVCLAAKGHFESGRLLAPECRARFAANDPTLALSADPQWTLHPAGYWWRPISDFVAADRTIRVEARAGDNEPIVVKLHVVSSELPRSAVNPTAVDCQSSAPELDADEEIHSCSSMLPRSSSMALGLRIDVSAQVQPVCPTDMSLYQPLADLGWQWYGEQSAWTRSFPSDALAQDRRYMDCVLNGFTGAVGTNFFETKNGVVFEGPPPPDNFTIPAECAGKQPAGTTWGRVDVWDQVVHRVDAERFYDIFDDHYQRKLGRSCEEAQADFGMDRNPCLWPGNPGLKQQIVIRQNEYAALKFVARGGGQGPSAGSINFEDGSFGGSTKRILAYSKCPGQFTDLAPECVAPALAGSFRWSDGSGPASKCELEPGETYYLNIINAESLATLTSPTCPTSSCANLTSIGGQLP